MALIKCNINGTDCEIDESALTAFRDEIDTDAEHTVITGWKLYGAVVQNDVHMTLKKAAAFAESAEGSVA